MFLAKSIKQPIFFLLLCLLGLSSQGAAERLAYFEFTPPAREAYQKAIQLRFAESKSLLAKMKQDDPENLIVYHIENYIDFFTIFLDENEEEFRRLEANKDRRLQFIQKGDRNSPYYLYTQAEIKLQWALARLKFEEYFSALIEVRSAYKLLKKNQTRFPNFVANKKSLGILHALVGTIPDNYRWGVKLLGGLSGTIEQGRTEIEEVLTYAKSNTFIFEEETRVMYALLMLHLENQQEEAWRIVKSSKLQPQSNPLAAFVLANVAMHTGRNDEAIRILESRPQSKAFHHFSYLDYMQGLTKLYRLDNNADVYFKRYLEKFRGKNYIKEAYQKIAWHHLIHNNQSEYQRYIKQCKIKGFTIIGGDKQALKEAKEGNTPDARLLRARLLFDGGYHQKAFQLLQSNSAADFPQLRHQLEWTYRLGRITHALSQYDQALRYYQQTVDSGRSYGFYFACNAALQQGIIYEQQKNVKAAKAAYKNCLSMNPDEYGNGLHQKAKAGLGRIKRQ